MGVTSVSVETQLGDRLIEVEQHLADARANIDRLHDNMVALLRLVAKNSRPCIGCQKLLWFVKLEKTGKFQVYEADGTPHWGRCPNADQFKKAKEQAK